jgi:hypothetical protein
MPMLVLSGVVTLDQVDRRSVEVVPARLYLTCGNKASIIPGIWIA